MWKVKNVSDFFPAHYAIVILRLQNFKVVTLNNGALINYWSSPDRALTSLIIGTGSKFLLSFGLLNTHLNVFLTVLKTSLAYRHLLTAFSTMGTSLQITNSSNANYLQLLPFCELCKIHISFRKLTLRSTCHRSNRLQISIPDNQQFQCSCLLLPISWEWASPSPVLRLPSPSYPPNYQDRRPGSFRCKPKMKIFP